MAYRHVIGSRSYVFDDLRDLMAKATPLRSGDVLAGIAARLLRRTSPPRWRSPTCRSRPSCRGAGPLRDRRRHPPDHRHPRRRGLRAHRAPDGRRVPRLAAVGATTTRGAGAACAGHHAGDGGGRLQDHAQPGPHPGRAQMPGRHPLSQHDRPARDAWPCACSRTTRPTIRRGIAASILDGLLLRLRRRRHRHQSGHRQRRDASSSCCAMLDDIDPAASRSRRRPACSPT